MCIYIRKFIDTFAHGTKKEGASFCSRDGDKRKTFSFIAHAKRLKGKRVDFSQKKKTSNVARRNAPDRQTHAHNKITKYLHGPGAQRFLSVSKKSGANTEKNCNNLSAGVD